MEQEKLNNEWKEHRRSYFYRKELEKDYIDSESSHLWLKNGALPFDGERVLGAAQDLCLPTISFKMMAHLSVSDRCRFCHTELESVWHLISGCQVLLADGHYTDRHNRVCK